MKFSRALHLTFQKGVQQQQTRGRLFSLFLSLSFRLLNSSSNIFLSFFHTLKQNEKENFFIFLLDTREKQRKNSAEFSNFSSHLIDSQCKLRSAKVDNTNTQTNEPFAPYRVACHTHKQTNKAEEANKQKMLHTLTFFALFFVLVFCVSCIFSAQNHSQVAQN